MAIIVFEGMQSHRCAAPPTMSRSTSVTLAPSLAAVDAADVPAGPAPRMRKRTAISPESPRLEDPEALAQHVADLAQRGVGGQCLLHRIQEVLVGLRGL